jgi:hypothetical protein
MGIAPLNPYYDLLIQDGLSEAIPIIALTFVHRQSFVIAAGLTYHMRRLLIER